MFIEYFYVGPEFIKHAFTFYSIANRFDDLDREGKVGAEVNKLKAKSKSFFKNYDRGIDQQIFEALTPMYIDEVGSELLPEGLSTVWKKMGDKIFQKSMILFLPKGIITSQENTLLNN